MLRVVFVISVESGEVLDYEFKSKFCFECKTRGHWDKNSDCYKNWLHENIYSIKHTSSSESIEKAAAVEMFGQSISLHNLKYTTYVGDGNSSSFGEVCEAMKKKYGNNYLVLKENCMGHIRKTMGTNLRKYKRDVKGKLSDGGTVGGRSRLTNAGIDNFQNHYGAAIKNNKNSLHKMKDAIWTIYYHCMLCENEPLS